MKTKQLMTAAELKRLLKANNISQRAMARMLDIDERTMRRYISGDLKMPRLVQLAVSCIIDHDDEYRDGYLRDAVQSNEVHK